MAMVTMHACMVIMIMRVMERGQRGQEKMEVKWGKRGTGRHSDRKDICISHFEAGFFLKERKFASYISRMASFSKLW